MKIISDIRYLGRQGVNVTSNFNHLNLVRTDDDRDFAAWLRKKTFTYDSPQIQIEIRDNGRYDIPLAA